MEATPNWIRDVWFSDEAHFHVNSHNNIFWGSQCPDEVEEKSLKGWKVTAFVAVSVFGWYWFEDKNGRMVTINQERSWSIVKAFYEDLKQSMSTAALRRRWYPTYSHQNNCLSASKIRTTSSQFAYGR